MVSLVILYARSLPGRQRPRDVILSVGHGFYQRVLTIAALKRSEWDINLPPARPRCHSHLKVHVDVPPGEEQLDDLVVPTPNGVGQRRRAVVSGEVHVCVGSEKEVVRGGGS